MIWMMKCKELRRQKREKKSQNIVMMKVKVKMMKLSGECMKLLEGMKKKRKKWKKKLI